MPDRVADLLVLAAAGYATTVVGWTPALGWCAAALAIMAAYVRALGTSMGAPADFRGPMSKPQRMHLLAAASLLTAVEPLFWAQGLLLVPTLIVIVLGTVITIVRRTRAVYHFLERRHVS